MTRKLIVELTPAQLSALGEAVGFRTAGETDDISASDWRALNNAILALQAARPAQPLMTPAEAVGVLFAAGNILDSPEDARDFYQTPTKRAAAYRGYEKLRALAYPRRNRKGHHD